MISIAPVFISIGIAKLEADYYLSKKRSLLWICEGTDASQERRSWL